MVVSVARAQELALARDRLGLDVPCVEAESRLYIARACSPRQFYIVSLAVIDQPSLCDWLPPRT